MVDSHVVVWAVSAGAALFVLFLIYVYINNINGSKKKTSSASSGGGGGGGGGWTVYGSNNCGWTRKQVSEMDSKNVKYTFVDCDTQDCAGIPAFPTLKNDDGTVKVGFTPM